MKNLIRVVLILGFAITTSIGEIPTLSIQFLEFPSVIPGTVLKVEKVLNESTGKIELRKNGGIPLSMSELLNLENQEFQSKRARLKSLSEELYWRIPEMDASEKIKVVIHAKYPPIYYPDKTTHSPAECFQSSQSAAALAPIASMKTLATRHGLNLIDEPDQGKAACEVTKAQLEALKNDADVGVVEAFHTEKSQSTEFYSLASSAYNPGSVPSGSGSGVRAATFEFGLSQSFLNCISASPAEWDSYTTSDQLDIRHSEAVFLTLARAAPSASLYHRKSLVYDGTNDINYLVSKSIQTVSISRTRGSDAPFHSTYSEFLVMDDFAFRAPFPVFVNLSGNNGYQYEVNWQGYNSLSVGNVRHTNNSAYEMADCTHAKNPPPIYGSCISGSGENCAGDREMPHLIVPGIPNSGSDFSTNCFDGSGSLACGTSWSAAIANGMAADVIGANYRMVGWPEKVRATLILTGQNVDGGNWASGTDGRDGTGVISGSEAVLFAQNHTSVLPGNSAAEKGMSANSMYANDFSSNKRFYFSVPNPKPTGKHLRVVLTWDSNPIVGGSTNALSDLDLVVQTNGSTRGSYSWDNNVEVVDVAADSLTAGISYYIDVVPATNRIPASGSRTNFFYYAVAWTWVKDHAPQ
jgi:hypothetical protein